MLMGMILTSGGQDRIPVEKNGGSLPTARRAERAPPGGISVTRSYRCLAAIVSLTPLCGAGAAEDIGRRGEIGSRGFKGDDTTPREPAVVLNR